MIAKKQNRLPQSSSLLPFTHLCVLCSYEEDIRNIAEHLPRVCQGFLMSATLNPEVDSLKQLVLHTPAVLKLNEAVQKKAVRLPAMRACGRLCDRAC